MMKKIIAIFATVLLFYACQNDDNNSNAALYGKWQLVAQWYGDAIEDDNDENTVEWTAMANGEIYSFNPNGDFAKSNTTSENCEGDYQYNASKMQLTIDCGNSNIPINYQVEQENNHIILTPLNMNCIEGCKFKFLKID